jgi:DNA-binding Xre family transcriptional regulator
MMRGWREIHGSDQHLGGELADEVRNLDDADGVAEWVALHLVDEAMQMMAAENISRSELAKQMGVSRARVTAMLNGSPNLTLRSIAQLAIALGTRPHASLRPVCPPIESHSMALDKAAMTGVVSVSPGVTASHRLPIGRASSLASLSNVDGDPTATAWVPLREAAEVSS